MFASLETHHYPFDLIFGMYFLMNIALSAGSCTITGVCEVCVIYDNEQS